MSKLSERLTVKEKLEIVQRVNRMKGLMDDLEGILDRGRKGELEPVKGLDNVSFILPDMAVDYNKLASTEMPFIRFVEIFEAWLLKLSLTIRLNGNGLRNKAVTRHMEGLLDTCRIIEYATKAHFGSDLE